MQVLKIVFQWFIYSSKNPTNLSLTLKGLTGILIIFGIDSTLAGEFTDSLIQTILGIAQAISAVLALYGFGRKLVLTFKH